MYTKAEYLRDVKNYDFKKYKKVEVVSEGDCPNNLVFKVLLNDKIVYQTRKGAFGYKKFKNHVFVKSKWIFGTYKEIDDVTITWKDNKDFLRFNSWCGNYRVQGEIKAKFQDALDEFRKDI